MDRPRIARDFNLKRRKLAWVVGGFIALSGVALAIARLEPGAPSVAREQLYLDEVKIGTLERKVRGPGVLQPREARWLSTRVDARVDRVVVRAGEAVPGRGDLCGVADREAQRGHAEDSAAGDGQSVLPGIKDVHVGRGHYERRMDR